MYRKQNDIEAMNALRSVELLSASWRDGLELRVNRLIMKN
jgi:hypothetical protein